MLDLVMNNAIQVVVSRQEQETEERKKQYKRKEFEVITKHGARNTRSVWCNLVSRFIALTTFVTGGRMFMMCERESI